MTGLTPLTPGRSIALLFLLTASLIQASTLTGVVLFSTDEAGNAAGNFVWDSRGASDYFKVWIVRGAPGGSPNSITNPFANGPAKGQADVNIPLTEGTNFFTIFFEYNGTWPSFGLNLSFDSNTVSSISVKGGLGTNNVHPPFSANSSPNTYGMASPFPDSPGSGSLHAALDQEFVSLSDYFVAAPQVFQLDRVAPQQVGPDAVLDYVGVFSLVVDRFRILGIRVSEVSFCWPSVANQNYQVQYRSTAVTNGWLNLGNLIPGNGSTNCIFDQIGPGVAQRFYRVVQAP